MGYLQIGKQAVNYARNLTRPNIYNKLGNPEILSQEIKALTSQLPKEAQGNVKLNMLKVMMGAQMAKSTLLSIRIDKKKELISSLLKKYNKEDLREIIQAKSSDDLGKAVCDFTQKIENNMPVVYKNWLGIPQVPPAIEKKGFDAIRKYFLENIQGKCSKKDFQKLASAKGEAEFENCSKTIIEKIKAKKRQGNIPLEIEQAVYKHSIQRNDTLLDICKIIKQDSTNPKVIEIENILKEKYGMKFVDLANNEELANKVLESVKLAHSKGIQTPNNIIISNLQNDCGEALIHTNLEKTVMLENTNPTDVALQLLECNKIGASPLENKIYDKFAEILKLKEQMHLSTTHPCHTVIHEFNHLGQLNLLASRFKKIPTEFEPTYRNLSGYAASGTPGEVEAELLTKLHLGKLNEKEERLLQYFC